MRVIPSQPPISGWEQGDFNGDHIVDQGDLPPKLLGTVDFLDFQILLDYWCPGGWNFAPEQTPEPATLTMLVLGGLALLRRRSGPVIRRGNSRPA